MTKIVFNNNENEAVEISGFNRNTSFSEDNTISNAYVNAIGGVAILQKYGIETITSIKIYNDEEVIYELDNLNAKISNIDEYLNNEQITVNANILFNI